jgi:hypothetical protein
VQGVIEGGIDCESQPLQPRTHRLAKPGIVLSDTGGEYQCVQPTHFEHVTAYIAADRIDQHIQRELRVGMTCVRRRFDIAQIIADPGNPQQPSFQRFDGGEVPLLHQCLQTRLNRLTVIGHPLTSAFRPHTLRRTVHVKQTVLKRGGADVGDENVHPRSAQPMYEPRPLRSSCGRGITCTDFTVPICEADSAPTSTAAFTAATSP